MKKVKKEKRTKLNMTVKLLDITENSEKMIEKIGRVCYNSEDKITEDSYKRFIKMLLTNGHTSVFEHAKASFVIEGSRNMTHQLVRHRLASYTQLSQRYVSQKDNNCVLPPDVENNEEAKRLFEYVENISKDVYSQLLNLGIKKEDARYVLPSGMNTKIYMTANFREWLHFINVRSEKMAQWEIRDMAIQINSILNQYAPNIFK
jgi:thymidylate synthase (FAD)